MRNRKEHVNLTGLPAYDLLTEYLSYDDKNKLTAALNDVKDNAAEIRQFTNFIEQGDWVALFNATPHAEVPARLLRYLRDGHITTMQYITGQTFFNVYTPECNNALNVKMEKIYNEKQQLMVNSRNKIEATMKIVSSNLIAYLHVTKKRAEVRAEMMKRYLNRFHALAQTEASSAETILATVPLENLQQAEKAGATDWLSPEESNNFYQLLRKMPASEQRFLILQDPYFDGENILNKTSTTQQINYRLGFNIFSRLRVDKKPMLMIPSAGMMEAYLQATRPTSRMPAVYRFGLSPVAGLHKTMKEDRRDKVISTPLLPHLSPTEADQFPTRMEYAEAEQHDFYHEALGSNIPKPERKFMGTLIDELQAIAEHIPSVKVYVDVLAEVLIDLEYRAYDRHLNTSPYLTSYLKLITTPIYHAPLWLTLDLADMLAVSRAIIKYDPSEDELKELPKSFDLAREQVGLQLAEWFIQQDMYFYLNYKLPLTDFLKLELTPRSLVGQTQANVKSGMQRYVVNQTLTDLCRMERADSKSPLKAAYISTAMKEIVRKDIINGLTVAQVSRSPRLLDVLNENFFENFNDHIKNKVIVFAKCFHKSAYDHFIAQFRRTDAGDKLMLSALPGRLCEINKDIFNELYDPRNPDYVYPSDHRTLLQRVVEIENIELLLKLTNDGASVDEVPSAMTPCPLTNSTFTGRYELMVLMMFAYQHGAGWVAKLPTEVARIRRMAAAIDRNDYSEHKADAKWAEEIIATHPIPARLLKCVNWDEKDKEIAEVQRSVHGFFDKLNANGQIGLDANDPDVIGFMRAKKWSARGGTNW